MLSVAGDDRYLFAVLSQGVKLERKGRLELLPRRVRKLCGRDKSLGFGPDQFLFQHRETNRCRVFVLEMGDLIDDLLSAIPARLDRGLDVPNAFESDSVLIVPVDVLVFEHADFVDEHAELVGDVGDVWVASFTPVGELVLLLVSVRSHGISEMSVPSAYRHLPTLLSDLFDAPDDVLFHLDELRQFLGQVRGKCAGGCPTECVCWMDSVSLDNPMSVVPLVLFLLPKLPLPKSRPDFVEDTGTDCCCWEFVCAGVGARVWRIEYERFIVDSGLISVGVDHNQDGTGRIGNVGRYIRGNGRGMNGYVQSGDCKRYRDEI